MHKSLWRNVLGGQAARRSGGGPRASAGRVFCLLPLVAGCGGAEHRQAARAGWIDETPWRLETVWQVGGAHATGAYAWGPVSGLAVDAAGRAYLVDRQAQAVHVIGPAGDHVRTIGRAGAGPREFQDIYGVGITPDQRVWVIDNGNARYTVFDTAGALLETYPRETTCYGWAWPGRATTDGRILDVTCGLRTARGTSYVVRFDTTAVAHRDTVTIPHAEGRLSRDTYELTSAEGFTMRAMAVPFSPGQHYVIAHDGTFWVGWSGRYRLVHLTPAGDTLAIAERDVLPGIVRDDERAEAVARVEEFIGPSADVSRIPEHQPYFAALRTDDAGFLWVRRRDARGNDVFDVFYPDGAFLGSLPTPPMVTGYVPLVIRGEDMWYVGTDEFDTPVLVRTRIAGRTQIAGREMF